MNLSVPLPKDQKKLPVYVFFKDYNRVPLKVKRWKELGGLMLKLQMKHGGDTRAGMIQ